MPRERLVTRAGDHMSRVTLVVAALACASMAASAAMAQSRGRGGSRDEDTLPPSVPPKVSTLTPTRGISGPRLEPGAVICNTEQDLQHRGEVNRRIADGVPDPGDPLSGCRLVSQERGVDIVSRPGPGRLQVKVKPSGEVGWTDAFIR